MGDAIAPSLLTSRSSLLAIARDIKLHHSVFALPFALLGMFLAAGSVMRLPRVGEVVLIVVCMVLARTFAMVVNRWADAKIDANNPRTAKRAIPSGRVSAAQMIGVAQACAVLFIAAAGGFLFFYDNPWPLVLSPVVLVLLASYSFAKRFTALCHLLLGAALAASPIAAAIALEPAYLAHPTIWLLAVMVAGWVAGFDVIYALQDEAFDHEAGLFSLPSKLGTERALWVSRCMHAVAMGALVATWWLSPLLATWFAVGVVLTATLLLLEHAIVWGSKTHHLHITFFTLNGVISVVLGALGIADVWLSVR